MSNSPRIGAISLVSLALGSVIALSTPAAAGRYDVVYSFSGGVDGENPANLIVDSRSNIYGITVQGGTHGFGTVFKITSAGVKSTLWNFQSGLDGRYPSGRLALDARGTLFGTASGGVNDAGVVYQIPPSGTESIVYAFADGADGANPVGGVQFGPRGYLYGTTFAGGQDGQGTVYQVSRSGRHTVLRYFAGGTIDGCQPTGGIIADASSTLFGLTSGCGNDPSGANEGTAFSLDFYGEHVLKTFAAPNGDKPVGTPVMNAAQTVMFAATATGGYGEAGSIVRFNRPSNTTTTWTEVMAYSFTNGDNGGFPNGDLVLTGAGTLYGTTQAGGRAMIPGGGGALWSLDATGTFQVLHSFGTAAGDGTTPYVGLVKGPGPRFYGTTGSGGAYGFGTVYRYIP